MKPRWIRDSLALTAVLTLSVGLASFSPASARADGSGGTIVCAPATDGAVDATINVPKIDGLPADFMNGVDISTLIAEENSGVVYRDASGTPTDIFTLLSQAGVNYIRVRVWNDPYNRDPGGQYDGVGYGAGNADIANAVAIGERATAAGMPLLIDFHYSDFWADPGQYSPPKAWSQMDLGQKETAIYDYTYDSLRQLHDAGVDVGMVQIGNEISNGVAGVTGFNRFTLISYAAEAIRDVDAADGTDTLIAVHFANPASEDYVGHVTDLRAAMTAVRPGLDFDVFLSSYYPEWHGTLTNLTAQLTAVAQMGYPVVVAETSWWWTSNKADDPDGADQWPAASDLAQYPASIQGQADELAAVIGAVGDVNKAEPGKGIGVFYWEPAWLATPGIQDMTPDQQQALWLTYGNGWASAAAGAPDATNFNTTPAGGAYSAGAGDGGGSSWDNQALFGPDGTVYDSLNTFRYVRTGAINPDAPPADLNLLGNPGFESGDLTCWTVDPASVLTATANGSQVSVKTDGAGGNAHDGAAYVNSWFDASETQAYTLSQTVTGLAPGLYEASVFVQGSTGDTNPATLFLSDGVDPTATFGDGAVFGAWGDWQRMSVRLQVSGDTVTVGLDVPATGTWIDIDSFCLVRLGDIPDPTVISSIEQVTREMPLGATAPTQPLPDALTVTYQDGHTADVPVVWQPYDVTGLTKIGQVLTVAGQLQNDAKTPVTADIVMTNPYADCVNLLVNGSFETGGPDGWTFAGAQSTSSPRYTTEMGSVYDGTYALNSWSDVAMDYTLTQPVALTPGRYVAWGAAQGVPISGGDDISFAVDAGGQALGTGAFTGLGTWKDWSVPLVPFALTDAVSADFTVTVRMAANDWATLDDFTLCRIGDAAAAPTVTGPDDVVVRYGQPASFAVAATAPDGGALTYQWQVSPYAGVGFADIVGATSPSYDIAAVDGADDGTSYRCVVTNTLDGTTASVTSVVATLTVLPLGLPAGPASTPGPSPTPGPSVPAGGSTPGAPWGATVLGVALLVGTATLLRGTGRVRIARRRG